MRRTPIPVLMPVLNVALAAVAFGGERPARMALAADAPESLVRTGSARYVWQQVLIKSMSFTLAGGRLTSAHIEKEPGVTRQYDVTLYLDEGGARSALARFKARDLPKQLAKDKLHKAVLEGDFSKIVVLSFSEPWKAAEIKEAFSDALRAWGDPGKEDLETCLARDFKAGDEVVIQAPARAKVTLLAGGEPCEIPSPGFDRILLGIWIGRDKLSERPDGLLSEAAPLLAQEPPRK